MTEPTAPFVPNFTDQKVDTGNSSNTMPAGTLGWGVPSVRGVKNSQTTQGEYADVELTVLGGPYEGRKMFLKIANPFDLRNSEKWRQMGFGAVLHMVEAAGLVSAANPAGYEQLNALSKGDPSAGFLTIMSALDGKAVAWKSRIERDKDKVYPDRDSVADWLSPNPTRSTFKEYQALAEGRINMKPVVPGVPQGAAVAPAPAFGAPAAPVVAAPAAFAPAVITPAVAPAAPVVGPNAPAPAFLQANPLMQAAQGGAQAPVIKPPF